MSAEIKFFTFNSGSIWEFPHVFRPLTRPGNSQSQMPVLSRDREYDVPEYSGPGISRIFGEISGSREMAFGNADL